MVFAVAIGYIQCSFTFKAAIGKPSNKGGFLMKKMLCVLTMGILVMSGCSDSASKSDGFVPTSSTNQDIQLMTLQSDKEKGNLKFVTNEQDTVFWNHKEIKNLERLNEFLYNVANSIEDRVRVESTAKDEVVEIDNEGKIVETSYDNERLATDLSYDGDNLFVMHNGVTKEYEKIFVKERFNDHYNGTFIEYFVEDKDGKSILVLQIIPILAENLDGAGE